MILVDTSYFVALTVLADQHHGRAARWSRRVVGPMLVTEYVLVETLNALARRDLRTSAVDVVDTVRSGAPFVYLPSAADLWDVGLALYRQRADKDWSLTDCISFHAMAERGIRSALTYDHHFEQAGFEPLLRREP